VHHTLVILSGNFASVLWFPVQLSLVVAFALFTLAILPLLKADSCTPVNTKMGQDLCPAELLLKGAACWSESLWALIEINRIRTAKLGVDTGARTRLALRSAIGARLPWPDALAESR
jgi:hypothetical protein